MFKGIQINTVDGYQARFTDLDNSQLGDGDVSIDIDYSTLNFKDALAITGKGKIIRDFPMIPGIDFAGTVSISSNEKFKAGDHVLLNGFGVGERSPGGLAQKATVPAKYLIHKPKALSTKECMMLGTAGYTAMLCVLALQKQGVEPSDGEVLVTGANGGVGSVAIMLLSKLGYTVVASTGRPEEAEYLKKLGAHDIIERSALSAPGKPLAKERWAGVVDSVGSHTLANACAATKYNGVVTACGLAQGMDFNASVAPFILRGVKLIGIDSVMKTIEERVEAWAQLALLVDTDLLNSISRDIPMSDVVQCATHLLDGKIRGRVVVDVNQ